MKLNLSPLTIKHRTLIQIRFPLFHLLQHTFLLLRSEEKGIVDHFEVLEAFKLSVKFEVSLIEFVWLACKGSEVLVEHFLGSEVQSIIHSFQMGEQLPDLCQSGLLALDSNNRHVPYLCKVLQLLLGNGTGVTFDNQRPISSFNPLVFLFIRTQLSVQQHRTDEIVVWNHYFGRLRG